MNHRTSRWLFSLLIALFLLLAEMHAHKINIFAAVEGEHIRGMVYFQSGAKAKDVTVKLLNQASEEISRQQTDDQGRFSFKTDPAARSVRVTTGDGHSAAYPLTPKKSTASPTDTPEHSATSQDNLETQVRKAIQEEIRPLREQLFNYEQKIRFHDILAGIGFILGLAGMAILIKHRKQP